MSAAYKSPSILFICVKKSSFLSVYTCIHKYQRHVHTHTQRERERERERERDKHTGMCKHVHIVAGLVHAILIQNFFAYSLSSVSG